MLTRRVTLAALATIGLAPRVRAQNFPSHPITIVVPYPPGGPIDLLARVIAQEADLGQSIVVDNRAGGSGIIGSNAVARAEPEIGRASCRERVEIPVGGGLLDKAEMCIEDT